jgi:hypothetical protein
LRLNHGWTPMRTDTEKKRLVPFAKTSEPNHSIGFASSVSIRGEASFWMG